MLGGRDLYRQASKELRAWLRKQKTEGINSEGKPTRGGRPRVWVNDQERKKMWARKNRAAKTEDMTAN